MKDTLLKLCSIDGISSREDEIRAEIRKIAENYAQDIREDSIGNLIVFKKGKKTPKHSVALLAHMDEVGLLVTRIAEDGTLKVIAMGIDPRVLPGKRVTVGEKKLPGVLGILPVHLQERDLKAIPAKSLYVDIGAKDKKDAESIVQPGDGVHLVGPPLDLGNGFIRAKAIDDRVGCTVLLELLKETQAIDATYVFTCQEEVGLRGGRIAGGSVNPDIALIVEGTTAADLPEVPKHRQVCHVGNGVVLPFMDNSVIPDHELAVLLRSICQKRGIPWQTKEYVAGGTDAGAIQGSGDGTRVVVMAAPVRYLHTSSSVANWSDIEKMPELASAFLSEVDDLSGKEKIL